MTKMKMSKTIPAAIFAILLLVVGPAEAAIKCSDVVKDLRPCLSYLVSGSGSGKPPKDCCTGATTLSSAATTAEDKKAACQCIKTTSKNMKVNDQLAKDLPENCGISLPFDVSPNVDCSTVG